MRLPGRRSIWLFLKASVDARNNKVVVVLFNQYAAVQFLCHFPGNRNITVAIILSWVVGSSSILRDTQKVDSRDIFKALIPIKINYWLQPDERSININIIIPLRGTIIIPQRNATPKKARASQSVKEKEDDQQHSIELVKTQRPLFVFLTTHRQWSSSSSTNRHTSHLLLSDRGQPASHPPSQQDIANEPIVPQNRIFNQSQQQQRFTFEFPLRALFKVLHILFDAIDT